MKAEAGLIEETHILAELVDKARRDWPGADSALAEVATSLTDATQVDNLMRREEALGDVAWDLRRVLLGHASENANSRFRSPEHHLSPTLPSGTIEDYVYERNGQATALESRLASGHVEIAGARTDHVAFSSCMAAFQHAIQSIVSLLKPTEHRPLRIGHWGSYFESDVVLQYLSSSAVSWTSLTGTQGPVDVNGLGLLSLEPVRYNWDLHTAHVPSIITAWRQAPDRPRIIVIDTTLSSFTWDMAAFVAALRDGMPLLVVEVRSGLKLDQQGLELANVGVASVHSVDEGPGVPTAKQLSTYLRLVRGVTGTSLNAAALSALDVPWAFDPNFTRLHAGRVFLNNRTIASSIPAGGLFSQVAHPSLGQERSSGSRAAPFVVFRMHDEDLSNHRVLSAAFSRALERRGGGAVQGSSFGFRGHRFETIVPRTVDNQGLFKVAAGARRGPQLDALIDALNEMAAFPDMDALRKANPLIVERVERTSRKLDTPVSL